METCEPSLHTGQLKLNLQYYMNLKDNHDNQNGSTYFAMASSAAKYTSSQSIGSQGGRHLILPLSSRVC